MSLYRELKRRNVFRVAIAYLALAWVVTEVADTLLPAFGIPDWGFRFIVIVFALGFVPALTISWVYEFTPEGLKREKDVIRDASITHFTARRLDGFTIGLIGVALAFILVDRLWLGPRLTEHATASAEVVTDTVQPSEAEPQYPPNSIAVLPFLNMSGDPGNEYFSDGVSEELLSLLAKIPELRVTSRSSAFTFKGEKINIPDVARKLNVAHILEGSVRKAGSQVRITAQLIEAQSDTHLWSETYDRQLDDIFAIQDEIAATVVEQLKIALLGSIPKVQEADPEAYALYLQARQLGRLNSAEGFEQSNALYEKALAIDLDYADAWNGLATNYRRQVNSGLLSADEGFNQARDAAEKALVIDPNYAPAHANLGWVAMSYDNDLAKAARHFERTLELDPANTDNIRNAAVMLRPLGRLDEAVALSEYVTTRDPVNPVGHYNLGGAYLLTGRWDNAIASFQTTLRLSPDFIGVYFWLGVALLYEGEPKAALDAFAQEEGDEEFRVKGTALALYALGRMPEYEEKFEELIERWGGEWPSEIAHVYAYTGDADAAFQWLEKAAAEEAGAFSAGDLFLQPLHADPRWLPLLQSIGKSPEQVEAIKFNVTLP